MGEGRGCQDVNECGNVGGMRRVGRAIVVGELEVVVNNGCIWNCMGKVGGRVTRMCMAGRRWNQYLRSEEKEESVVAAN